MQKGILALLVAPLLILTFCVSALSDTSIPEKKQTTLGLYITALEAFTKWHIDPNSAKILDVRTAGEYIFVGHAPMANNIPILFLKNEYDSTKKMAVMPANENFVEAVKKKFKETDTLLVMCRSGGRSAYAINLLAKAGFKNVYNIVDGFEGDALKIEGSYNNGRRLINGWKNSGAPWTYELDPDLMYLP
jgi:rhodanese-related sulfurtransferase